MMNPRQKTPRVCRRMAGFSIMEVLIAMIVLAIGLLGLAALQAQGLRFNQDAYNRSQATGLAYDIIDRMRANRDNSVDYVQADPGLVCDPSDNGADLVEMDLSCWFDAVEAALPGAAAAIQANADPDYYDVTIRWVDREAREFGGETKLAESAAECTALPSRFWDAANARCMVEQTWTVWP